MTALTELLPGDPRLERLVGQTHQRFQRLVEEAEIKARPYYRKVLGREASIQEVIAEIFTAVEREGDEAVARYSRIFDGATIAPERVRATPDELAAAWKATPVAVRDAMSTAITQVQAYQRRLLPRGFGEALDEPLGVRWTALDRVGAYMPGGTGGTLPLPSSVIMNLVPAKVAGVRQTVLASPPRADGSIAPELLAAAHAVGVDEVWRVGGIVAIAAMACGTPALGKVDKIVGPGNIFVTLAKRFAYGRVDLDMLAGPSEVLVIADTSVDPAFVAADLLSQAEHDALATVVCLALDGAGTAIQSELARQLATLPAERRETAADSLARFGTLVPCRDLDQAVELSNRFAPEHLELLVRDPKPLVSRLIHAGAIFVGPWSPEPIGDYVAGPSHTLPTGGTARMWSGIGADTFLRRTSLINLGEAEFRALAPAGIALARAEGLEAHARSIEVRLR
ncbi:MAG: histidinol dehydrogenase [Planctomycetes bacterium]|nr:histidinol dehydrogenase [Planctomycetota bacterium]